MMPVKGQEEEIVHLYGSVKHSGNNCGRGWSWETRVHLPRQKWVYFHRANALVSHSDRAPNKKAARQDRTRHPAGSAVQTKTCFSEAFTFSLPLPELKLEWYQFLSQMESPLRANQILKLSSSYTDQATRACCLRVCVQGICRVVLGSEQSYSWMLSRGILGEQNQIATQT